MEYDTIPTRYYPLENQLEDLVGDLYVLVREIDVVVARLREQKRITVAV